jgi:hypothetical protein
MVLQQFGVNIDSTSNNWKDFVETMRTATGAVPDYSKLIKDFHSINAILDDLDFGSIISEEDYNNLIAYNDEWERFFQMQADGTRRFIGDSEAMKKLTQDRFKNDSDKIQTEMDSWNAIKKTFSKGNKINFSTAENNVAIAQEWLKFKNNTTVKADMEKALAGAGYSYSELETIVAEAESGNTGRLNELYSRFAKM